MKTITTRSALVLLLALGFTARAQVSTNSVPVPNPISTVTGWLSSINASNSIWSASAGELRLGAQYISGVNASADVGGSIRIWKDLSFAVNTSLGNASGTLRDASAAVELNFSLGDLKVVPYLGGGYSLDQSRAFTPVGVRFEKGLAVGSPMFAYVGTETAIYWGNPSASRTSARITLGVGASF